MSKHYEDWADWAGDHPEQAEADLRKEAEASFARVVRAGLLEPSYVAPIEDATCEHAEADTQGVCEDCGSEVEGWEPDDAQLLTQTGTKEPTPIMLGVTSVETLPTRHLRRHQRP